MFTSEEKKIQKDIKGLEKEYPGCCVVVAGVNKYVVVLREKKDGMPVTVRFGFD